MFRKSFLFTALLIFTSACAQLGGTLEVSFATETPVPGIESSATPNPITLTPTQTTDLGQVTGSICYPSEAIPAMTAFFENQASGQATQLDIAENQGDYSIQLEPGEYLAYAYREGESIKIGGMYSQAIACGLTVDCSDHTPLIFSVM